MRIIEIAWLKGKFPAVTDDRLAPLELLEAHVHAGVTQSLEGGLQAAVADHGLEVGQFVSDQLQQGQIRTPRILENTVRNQA